MSKQAIRVEGLSKRYRIGKRERYRTIRDTITDGLCSVARAVRGKARRDGADEEASEFWALRDVSFEVQPGEVVGVIGRNGAGKSTLLKILSRVTEPTLGYAEIQGRVGSLLEVGTGFHPELTGRENIFLNGAILGMKRAEISAKFDEILAFAEVERLIDTAVKHYSSGMYLRLAFAVAAHLEPEILLVDEVLAVGDLQFQRKCLGKLGEVAHDGRTVLFVSHNMAAVGAFCSRCVLLENGSVAANGGVRSCISRYLALQPLAGCTVHLSDHPNRRSGCEQLLRSLRFSDAENRPCNSFRPDDSIVFTVQFQRSPRIREPHIGVGIDNWLGQRILTISTRYQKVAKSSNAVDSSTVRCQLPPLWLSPGSYSMKLTLGDAYHDFDTINSISAFEINACDLYGTGKLPPQDKSVILAIPAWSLS